MRILRSIVSPSAGAMPTILYLLLLQARVVNDEPHVENLLQRSNVRELQKTTSGFRLPASSFACVAAERGCRKCPIPGGDIDLRIGVVRFFDSILDRTCARADRVS